MDEAPTFVLSSTTLAVIGALIGSLAGAISFLFRQLVASKDSQIAAITREMELQRQVMLGQIDGLKADRDLFREMVLRDRAQPRRGGQAPSTADDDDDAPGGRSGVRRVR